MVSAHSTVGLEGKFQLWKHWFLQQWKEQPFKCSVPFPEIQWRSVQGNHAFQRTTPCFFCLPSRNTIQRNLKPGKHKNQSINSTKQDNNLKIINTSISHFSVSRKWIGCVTSNFRNITFCEKTENTAQVNSVTFDVCIIAFRPIIKCRAIRLLLFYNHKLIIKRMKDFGANNSNHWKSNIVHSRIT